MIVTCERCATQFQLDESRVPEGGARVRCSRCKHAFVVTPSAGTPEQEIHRAASRAIESGTTPDVTEDLLPESLEPSLADDESDWEFNDDRSAAESEGAPQRAPAGAEMPPFGSGDPGNSFGEIGPGESLSLAADDEPTAPVPRAPLAKRSERAAGISRVAAADPEVTDELGSPVDWDIFDDVAGPAAPIAAPARSIRIPLSIAAEGELDDEPGEAALWLRRAAAATGWFATAGLCALALLWGLIPAAPGATGWPDPAPGVALEEVRGRWLDNARVGRLYIVSGRLRNTTPAVAALPALVLELRDASGRAIGDPIPLGEPSPPELLREGDVAEIAAAAARWFARPLRSGEARDFEMVVWPLPPDAARFAIRAGGPPS